MHPVFSSPAPPLPPTGSHSHPPPSPPSPPIGPPPDQPTLRRRAQGPSRVPRVQIRGQVLPRQHSWWDWIVNLTLLPLQFAVTTASELYTFISK